MTYILLPFFDVYYCFSDFMGMKQKKTKWPIHKTKFFNSPNSHCFFHREKNTLEPKAECYANDKVKSPPVFRFTLRQFLVVFQQLPLYLSQKKGSGGHFFDVLNRSEPQLVQRL